MEKLKLNKKTRSYNIKKIKFNINDKEFTQELEVASAKILSKTLNVIYSKSSSQYVLDILQHKNIEELHDLQQEVSLLILSNNYMYNNIIKIKNSYYRINRSKQELRVLDVQRICRYINSIIYHSRKNKENVIALDIIREQEERTECVSCYIVEHTEKTNKIKKQMQSIAELKLTEKQKEILQMYANMRSTYRVAEVLNISRSAVDTTIRRIKNRIKSQAIQ